MSLDNYQIDHQQHLALARKLIAYGEYKQRAKRRAQLVRVARAIGKAVIVAGFLLLFILALCLEPMP